MQYISMKKSFMFSRRRGMDINLRFSSFVVKTSKNSLSFVEKIIWGMGNLQSRDIEILNGIVRNIFCIIRPQRLKGT
jgi:hypothetical protein